MEEEEEEENVIKSEREKEKSVWGVSGGERGGRGVFFPNIRIILKRCKILRWKTEQNETKTQENISSQKFTKKIQ